MNRKIIFMGTPEFATASLDALVHAGFNIAAVVTAPDRPAGRGRQLRESDVKRRALELGLPVLQPEKLRDPAFLAKLDELNATLYIVVAFRMLPELVWGKPALGTLNLHASLLPDYRGAAPINWAIIHGEKKTGVSTFFIQEEIDMGDLLLRRETEIGIDENAGALHDRLKVIGAELLVATVKDIFDGTMEPVSQAQFAGDDKHAAPKINTSDCRIQWDLDARRIHDLVRGMAPYPGAWTTWNEPGKPARQLKILRTHVASIAKRHVKQGHVFVQENKLLVQCGKGELELLEVQMEGKRAMSAKDFLNGIGQVGMVRLGRSPGVSEA